MRQRAAARLQRRLAGLVCKHTHRLVLRRRWLPSLRRQAAFRGAVAGAACIAAAASRRLMPPGSCLCIWPTQALQHHAALVCKLLRLRCRLGPRLGAAALQMRALGLSGSVLWGESGLHTVTSTSTRATAMQAAHDGAGWRRGGKPTSSGSSRRQCISPSAGMSQCGAGTTCGQEASTKGGRFRRIVKVPLKPGQDPPLCTANLQPSEREPAGQNAFYSRENPALRAAPRRHRRRRHLVCKYFSRKTL